MVYRTYCPALLGRGEGVTPEIGSPRPSCAAERSQPSPAASCRAAAVSGEGGLDTKGISLWYQLSGVQTWELGRETCSFASS